MLHHNHYCKHCDRNFSTCQLDARCLLPYDISKLHKCMEAKKYRKRMAIMLSSEQDAAPCAYGCSRPCNHPSLADRETAPVRAIVTAIAANVPAKVEDARNAPGGTSVSIAPRTCASVAPEARGGHFSGVHEREFAPRGSNRDRQLIEMSYPDRYKSAVIAMSKRG